MNIGLTLDLALWRAVRHRHAQQLRIRVRRRQEERRTNNISGRGSINKYLVSRPR